MYQPFVITCITWPEVTDKVAYTNTQLLREALNSQLTLSSYGDLQGIAFVYIVTPPEDVIHQETFRYSRKNRELYIEMRLPYEVVINSSLPEVLQLMASKYLQTLEEYLPKKKIPHFDQARFVADVRALFEREAWLQEAMVG